MAIFVKTSNPDSLVNQIRDDIRLHKVETWLCDDDGDFTHDTDQWRYHAWLSPKIEAGRVVFYIICRNDRNLSILDYAIYHGRFVEMLLSHYDSICQDIEVSPLATEYDKVNAENSR